MAGDGAPVTARGMLVAGAVVVVAVGAGGAALVLRAFAITQPFAFNHNAHVKKVGAECVDCHVHARDGARATIPNVGVCATCHADPVNDSAAAAAITADVTKQATIQWRKVTTIPDHVYFSHRRHTSVAGIACETCHGDMSARTLPITRPMLPVTMQRCMGCHETKGVTNDCVACHR